MRTSPTIYKASLSFSVLEKLGIYVMDKMHSNSQELQFDMMTNV